MALNEHVHFVFLVHDVVGSGSGLIGWLLPLVVILCKRLLLPLIIIAVVGVVGLAK